MKNLAPDLFRQRLLIEGFYSIEVNERVIESFFKDVTAALGLKMYGQPVIFASDGEGKPENQGYDAFVPLMDSGISLYVWSNAKFLSMIIYTCKGFNQNLAVDFTKIFFKIAEVESQAF